MQVPAALHLCKLGYEYLDEIEIYDHRTNILTDVFMRSLKRLNPNISESDARQTLFKVITAAGNSDLGREVYKLISANSGIKLIDFDNASNNE